MLYLVNLDDPIFQNEVQDTIDNWEDMQNYLLVTGNLNDGINKSLNFVFSNGHLNDGTAVCNESDLNPTTNCFKQMITLLM